MEITTDTIMLLIFVFIIAAYLGVELISKVPSQLHTPLMSGTNAISGITIVGSTLPEAMCSASYSVRSRSFSLPSM